MLQTDMKYELYILPFMENTEHIPVVENRLREVREAMGISQETLGKMIGTSKDNVSKMERGDRGLGRWLVKLSKVTGKSADYLLGKGEATKQIPIIGYVGAGGQVFPIDDMPLMRVHNDAQDNGENPLGGLAEDMLEMVDAPPGVSSRHMVALKVRGDSMMPQLLDGWVVFYNQRLDGAFDENLNKLCIVCTADDAVMVKMLRRGFSKGKYTLQSHNAEPIEDVALKWCAKVVSIKPS